MVKYNMRYVENFLLKMSITKSEFCWACNVPYDTLDRLYAMDGSVNAETLMKIVGVLNVRMDDFLGVK